MAKTDIKYQWAIEDIYSSVSDWENDYKKVLTEADFSEFKGKLNQKESFLSCMKKQEDVIRIFEKLSVYAMMLMTLTPKILLQIPFILKL